MTQWVEHLTFGLGSGHDLTGLEIKPRGRLLTQQGICWRFSALTCTLSVSFSHSLSYKESLKIIIKDIDEKSSYVHS